MDVVGGPMANAPLLKELKNSVALSPKPVSTDRVLGTWRNGRDAKLTFRAAKNKVLSISGYAQYESSTGSVSVGEFEGSVDKNSLRFGKAGIPSVGVDGADANDACYLEVKLVGSLLIVLDSGEILGKCGGYGATFSGVYSK